METITENTLQKPNIRHTVTIKADSVQLESALNFCKEKWGHHKGKNRPTIWSWRPKAKFRDRLFVFSFIDEGDALLFKLSKG